jgi:uncharacterized protein YprB with RNaseH-like and TPR domain
MAGLDLPLAGSLFVLLIIGLIIVVLGRARLDGFWDTSPAPSIQPTWSRTPGVRSGLTVPDAKLVYLDIETDPSGKVCCIALCEDLSLTAQFVADGPAGERKILEDFVRYAWSRRDVVFCYYAGMNKFDEAILRTRLKASSLPCEFFVMKDLFHTVRASLKLPRYGLKYVGARLGYRFSHWELQGGMIPALWKRSVRSHDDQLMKKLMEYNMDDAKALWYIADWFKKNHPAKIRKKPVKWRRVKKISPDTYEVPSFRGEGIYDVNILENRCTCPVSTECKHLQLVRELSGPELLTA